MTGEVFYSLFVLRSETRFLKVPITFGAGAPKYQITKTKNKNRRRKTNGSYLRAVNGRYANESFRLRSVRLRLKFGACAVTGYCSLCR